MKQLITITYRKGRKILAFSYVTEIKSPFCRGIEFDAHPKAESIAWNDVVSVTVQPAPQ